jgi:hypothetical protein
MDNFSNFSAWHYRSKLTALFFAKNNINWNSEQALEYFNKDLDKFTHAVFTDPKDQSPWNYNYWMIKNLTPIYIERIIYDNENGIKVKFSDIIRYKDIIECQIQDENNELQLINDITSENNNDYSDSIVIKIPENTLCTKSKIILSRKSVLLSLDELIQNLSLKDGEKTPLAFNNLCFSRYNLDFPKTIFTISEDKSVKYDPQSGGLLSHQRGLLESQLENIEKLLSTSQDFLEQAHSRKAQLLIILYFNELNNEKKKELLDSIIIQYEELEKNSKRLSKMYLEFLNKFTKLKQ